MDHNFSDSLNMESGMAVDLVSENIVTQADITLDGGGGDSISMDFEDIHEQQILMDTGNEEVIVSELSDYMGGGNQYTLQGYKDQQIEDAPDQSNQNIISDGSDDVVLQFGSPDISVQSSQAVVMPNRQIKYINVEASTSQIQPQSTSLLTAPRQIAIAPKPQQSVLKVAKTIPVNKQYAIAPKPVSLVKKVSLAGAMQANAQGKPVLAQIGKQLVMMPTAARPKLKLMTTPTVRLIGADQAKLMAAGTGAPKQLRKVIVQGTKVKSISSQPSDSGQTAMVTKVVSGAGAGQTARYVTMHQKTVPITIGNNKIILTSSPTKQGVQNQQQQVLIKAPALQPAQQSVQGGAPKKVVISTSQGQSVVVKSQPKTISVTSKGTPPGQKTQLHRIEVPGKGVQYIRLVTSGNSANHKPAAQHSANSSQPFVITDTKGNVIQMSGESSSGQPPPLVVTANAFNKVTPKPQQKLVRIAPVTSKPAKAAITEQITTSMQPVRSSKSLLAPSQPAAAAAARDMPTLELHHSYHNNEENQDPVDSKASLQQLIAETEHNDSQESDYLQTSSPDRSTESVHSRQENDHPLIVVPSFMKHDPDSYLNSVHTQEEREYNRSNNHTSSAMNVEVEFESLYTPRAASPEFSETDLIHTQFGLRSRKACNCTKSQCLKLYCDCFANGEFCNSCNCHNCHNNLENEELRQKAIRGCLDRNPYAFRPKIGKSKAVGPEVIRRHNKGCNCKRSGCLKNYCECYEAKIACSAICKCVGCRNVEDSLDRSTPMRHAPAAAVPLKQPCSFMTTEVIEAVCQCLVAAAADTAGEAACPAGVEPLSAVLDEFARCLQDIIGAAHHTATTHALHQAIA